MGRCRDCKTGAHIRRYRVEVAPGVWQDMYECRNCGRRWKRGGRYKETQIIRRTRLGKRGKKKTPPPKDEERPLPKGEKQEETPKVGAKG